MEASTANVLESIQNGKQYRVHFETRSAFTATASVKDGKVTLNYKGETEKQNRSFELAPDGSVPSKPNWGKLTKAIVKAS